MLVNSAAGPICCVPTNSAINQEDCFIAVNSTSIVSMVVSNSTFENLDHSSCSRVDKNAAPRIIGDCALSNCQVSCRVYSPSSPTIFYWVVIINNTIGDIDRASPNI